MHPFLRLRQVRKLFSYRTAESPPMPGNAGRPQNGTHTKRNHDDRRNIMMRSIPTTLTALQLALASAAAWLVCETNTLQGAAVLMFH